MSQSPPSPPRTPSPKKQPQKRTTGSRLSPEHQSNAEVTRRLAEDIELSDDEWRALSGLTIGIGGPISSGKSTYGAAVQHACPRPSHFAPEQVELSALGMYIENQSVPEWFRQQLDDDDDDKGVDGGLRYNRRFFDATCRDQTLRQDRRVRGDVSHADAHRSNPYATPFQIMMLRDCQHRVREAKAFHRWTERDGVALVDRTPWDNTVFEEANRLLYGSISTQDHAFYRNIMGAAPAFGVDCLVYLECDPMTTLARIDMRGSAVERAYQTHYMTFLHDIWFHRIVENFTVTEKLPYFGDERTAGATDAPFPIFVSDWTAFGSITDTLRRVARWKAGKAPPAPTVRFVMDEESADDCLHWDREYADADVSDVARQEFKCRVLRAVANGDSLEFAYTPTKQ